MFTLPPDYNTIFELSQPYFNSRIWSSVRLLLIRTILVSGQPTATAILRILGLRRRRISKTTPGCSIRQSGRVWR